MELSAWLGRRAGLAGKKLDGALKMCADNWIESISDLRELVEDEESEKQFIQAFPQAMLRKALIKAFKADTEENTSAQVDLQAKEDTAIKCALLYIYLFCV